ncbi:MAG: mechanosensitive ion channel [Planctomycetaceae bacterium]|nr:mechanosensitive ion channel [Planctomycetaceae bacterium]
MFSRIRQRERRFVPILLLAALGALHVAPLAAQNDSGNAAESEDVSGSDTEKEEILTPPQEVDVEPLAEDQEIANRLEEIFAATEWFEDAVVRVDQGVVFLKGSTRKPEHKAWAGELARNTQDVVAVVNRIHVVEPAWWDLTPAWTELKAMRRDVIQGAPLFAVAFFLLILTWFVSRLSISLSHHLFERRTTNRLLQQVAARAVAVPVFLMGLYLVLRIAGLTQMAATIVGGTGLIGLVVGIAFRDIAENFLASILISTQRPFAVGDLIEINGERGFVQSVTTRGTLLMTLDGNHLQIPNSTVYKATIRNLTANPKIRQDFLVGIGYDNSTTMAQEVARKTLIQHPVVLEDPEPLVLVEELGAATINLRVYFWINGVEHSTLKVRSSVIRQMKSALQMAGISMPDEAREMVFPNGVPVRMLDDASEPDNSQATSASQNTQLRFHPDRDDVQENLSTAAEGGLASEADEIRQQARSSRSPEKGPNLLNGETEESDAELKSE